MRETNPQRELFFDTVEEQIPLSLHFVRESVWSRAIAVICGELGVVSEVIGTWGNSPDVSYEEEEVNSDNLPQSLRDIGVTLLKRILGDNLYHFVGNSYRHLLQTSLLHSDRPLILTLTSGYSTKYMLDEMQKLNLDSF